MFQIALSSRDNYTAGVQSSVTSYVLDDLTGFLKTGAVCDGVKDKEDVCAPNDVLKLLFRVLKKRKGVVNLCPSHPSLSLSLPCSCLGSLETRYHLMQFCVINWKIYLSCCVQNVQCNIFSIHVDVMSISCFCEKNQQAITTQTFYRVYQFS